MTNPAFSFIKTMKKKMIAFDTTLLALASKEREQGLRSTTPYYVGCGEIRRMMALRMKYVKHPMPSYKYDMCRLLWLK